MSVNAAGWRQQPLNVTLTPIVSYSGRFRSRGGVAVQQEEPKVGVLPPDNRI
jgi:hypothetical protein